MSYLGGRVVRFDSEGNEIMDIDYDEYDALKKPQTNADRIRGMTDEELAEFLTEYRCVHKAPHCREADCTQCWLDWLKNPAKENE